MRIRISRRHQVLSFAYNPASQITTRSRSNDAYASSTIGNESLSYGVNGLNQYTSVDGSTYGYDDVGRLLSVDGPLPGPDGRHSPRRVGAFRQKTASVGVIDNTA